MIDISLYMLQGVALTGDNPCNGCAFQGETNCFELTGQACQSEDDYFIWVRDNRVAQGV